MTLCRVQQSPWQNSRVLKSLTPILQYRSTAIIRSTIKEYSFQNDILPIILDYINKPIFLGFISMAIRVIPLEDSTSAIQTLHSGIDKEIECALGEDRPQVLDYRCLFGSKADEYIPLHPCIPPRPELAWDLKAAFSDWKVIDPLHAW